jgi:hypothetical protein
MSLEGKWINALILYKSNKKHRPYIIVELTEHRIVQGPLTIETQIAVTFCVEPIILMNSNPTISICCHMCSFSLSANTSHS